MLDDLSEVVGTATPGPVGDHFCVLSIDTLDGVPPEAGFDRHE